MPPPPLFCEAKRKRRNKEIKERLSKQKRLSPRLKCYCFSYSRASRTQKFFCWANRGGQQYLSVFHGPSTLKSISPVLLNSIICLFPIDELSVFPIIHLVNLLFKMSFADIFWCPFTLLHLLSTFVLGLFLSEMSRDIKIFPGPDFGEKTLKLFQAHPNLQTTPRSYLKTIGRFRQKIPKNTSHSFCSFCISLTCAMHSIFCCFVLIALETFLAPSLARCLILYYSNLFFVKQFTVWEKNS